MVFKLPPELEVLVSKHKEDNRKMEILSKSREMLKSADQVGEVAILRLDNSDLSISEGLFSGMITIRRGNLRVFQGRTNATIRNYVSGENTDPNWEKQLDEWYETLKRTPHAGVNLDSEARRLSESSEVEEIEFDNNSPYQQA